MAYCTYVLCSILRLRTTSGGSTEREWSIILYVHLVLVHSSSSPQNTTLKTRFWKCWWWRWRDVLVVEVLVMEVLVMEVLVMEVLVVELLVVEVLVVEVLVVEVEVEVLVVEVLVVEVEVEVEVLVVEVLVVGGCLDYYINDKEEQLAHVSLQNR